jgi:beta-glucosidase
MKRLSVFVLGLFLITTNLFSFDSVYVAQIDKRVWNLISQFTIEEKIAALSADIKTGIPRLNIPDYNWHNESEHGLCIDNVTVFPQSINLVATWNLDLMYKVATAISDEARVKFREGKIGLNFWSPNINIARDPRWGRVQETKGEDPYLASRMAVAYITGMQGNDDKYFKTIATPKHYVVHSGPEPIRHQFDAIVNKRDLWETYMPAFKSSIMEAGAFSIMTAFNAVNGRPVTTNSYLIQEILRRQWGFKGFVTTDCNAIGDSFWEHKVGKNEREGAAIALQTGIDSECGEFYKWHLKNALDDGYLTEQEIDTSVFRNYKAKMLLGLYDDPTLVPFNSLPDSIVDSKAHSDLAIKAGKESIVLLKNNGVLPLKKDIKKILVVGPNANVFFENLGSYTGWPTNPVTILDGIKKTVSPDTKVEFSKEVEIGGSFTELVSSKNIRTYDGQPGLKGDYFINRSLSGEPAFTRVDTLIDFDFGYKDLMPGVSSDSFSVRWTGILRVDESGEYTFKVKSDDGTRLILDNKTVIDDYSPHSSITRIGYCYLEANKDYNVRFEYLQYWAPGDIKFEFGNKNTGKKQLDNITKMAGEYDVAIYVGGLSSEWENESSFLETEGFFQGDRTSLELPMIQQKTIGALANSGKPVIVVNLGTSMAMTSVEDKISANVHTWYLGQCAGDAVGAVLFGDYNPAGRTPVTFYKSVDDLPPFTNYDMTNRTYRYFGGEVLYPFGYGLSYTKFAYSDLSLQSGNLKICENDTTKVVYKLSNTGSYDGDEVVQLYVKYLDSRLSQPIKQLKQFKRINLKAGQTITDTLLLNLNELYSYDDSKNKYIIENGQYEIQIGASSRDIRLVGNIKIDNCGQEDTSVEDSDFKITVFPNPASDFITFNINSSFTNEPNFRIYNILGGEIEIKTEINTLSGTISFDCSELKNGVYLAVFANKKEKLYKRFIINR